MKSKVLADRARYLKGSAQEVQKVSYIVEELVNRSREEGRADERLETAAWLLGAGKMSEGELAAHFRFTPEQMDAVRSMSTGTSSPA